jgi:hypothetical protein
MLVVCRRVAKERKGLFDAGFGPFAQPRIAHLPLLQPLAQMLAGFLYAAAVVDPAQFDQAVRVGFARKIVERITQEVDLATLPAGFGQEQWPA